MKNSLQIFIIGDSFPIYYWIGCRWLVFQRPLKYHFCYSNRRKFHRVRVSLTRPGKPAVISPYEESSFASKISHWRCRRRTVSHVWWNIRMEIWISIWTSEWYCDLVDKGNARRPCLSGLELAMWTNRQAGYFAIKKLNSQTGGCLCSLIFVHNISICTLYGYLPESSDG